MKTLSVSPGVLRLLVLAALVAFSSAASAWKVDQGENTVETICATGDPAVPTLRIDLVSGETTLLANGACPERRGECLSNRWFGTKGDTLNVCVFSGEPVQVEYDEQARQTRFAEDLKVAKELRKQLGAPPPEWRLMEPKVLTRVRANLAVRVRETAAATDAPPRMSVTVVTGPPEHAFLSADLPVNSVSQLKREPSGNVVAKKLPKEFMLGVGYSLGDVRSDPAFWGDRLQVKALVAFSKSPLDAFGLGVGLRTKYLSPFGAYVWSQQDGEPESDGDTYEGAFRFGISVNLLDVQKMLKGNDE